MYAWAGRKIQSTLLNRIYNVHFLRTSNVLFFRGGAAVKKNNLTYLLNIVHTINILFCRRGGTLKKSPNISYLIVPVLILGGGTNFNLTHHVNFLHTINLLRPVGLVGRWAGWGGARGPVGRWTGGR